MDGYFISHINIFLALIGGLVMILLDYPGKYYVGKIPRLLMTWMIIFTLATMGSELIYDLADNSSGQPGYAIAWISNSLYFLFQMFSYAFMNLFIDINTQGNLSRLKKLSILLGSICGVNLVLLIVNFFNGFLFTISSDNAFVRGPFYEIQLVVSFLILILIFIDALMSQQAMGRGMFSLAFFAAVPALLGALADLLNPNLRLTRPCFFLSALFAYLFIVRKMNLIDGLTGINNRRSCDEYLSALTRNNRKKNYSFIMIDMDHFKEINDTYGHSQGDAALKDVASVLRACIRGTDFVARLGGDEFLIVLSSTHPDKVIDRIYDGIDAFNEKELRPFTLELSCGTEVYKTSDLRTPQEILGNADRSMYKNKQAHRGGRDARQYEPTSDDYVI